MKITTVIACCSVLLIARGAWAAPACNRAPDHIDQRVASAAGCFIKGPGKLLLVRQRFSGKLGFPAGFSAFGESAQCTAHRETWEETGLQVEVGKLAKQFGNGFLLYYCQLLLTQTIREPLPVPVSARHEISQILWRDPHTMSDSEWRFSWQIPDVLRLFDQLPE